MRGADEKLKTAATLRATKTARHSFDRLVSYAKLLLPAVKEATDWLDTERKREAFRGVVRGALSNYNCPITPEIDDILKNFDSASEEHTEWVDVIASEMEGALGLAPPAIKLIVYESEGRKGSSLESWMAVRASPVLLIQFSKWLLNHGIPRFSLSMSPAVMAEVTSQILLNSGGGFSREDLIRSAGTYERELEGVVSRLEGLAKFYNLGDLRSLGLTDIVPNRPTTVRDDVISKVAGDLGIKKEFLNLLYASSSGDARAVPLFAKIRAESILEFVQLLARARVLPPEITEDDRPGVSLLAKSQEAFDLQELRASSSRLHEYGQLASAFGNFLSQNEIPSRTLDLPEIVALVIASGSRARLDALRGIVELAVDGDWLVHLAPGDVLPRDRIEDIKTALLALFLYRRPTNVADARAACQYAAICPSAVRVVYELAEMGDSTLQLGLRLTAREAILRSLTKREDLPHLSEVQTRLASGIVPERLSDLASARLVEMKSVMEALSTQVGGALSITEILDNLTSAVHGYFEVNVDPEAIPGYLRDQLVQAYMITSPGGDPLIGTLESDWFELAIRQLAVNDPRYECLNWIAQGSGKATRVGVLPLGVTFDDFKLLLARALTRVSELSQSATDSPVAIVAAYVIRVSPSEDAMALVGPVRYAGTTPNSTIRALMVEHFGVSDTVTVLSAADTSRPVQVALRHVTEAVLNREESSLIAMVSSKIGQLLKAYPSLSQLEIRKRIDRSLFGSYSCKSVVDICKAVGTEFRGVGDGPARKRFALAMKEAVPKTLSHDVPSFELLADQVYSAARNVGLMLTT